jgi:hypothetical protein
MILYVHKIDKQLDELVSKYPELELEKCKCGWKITCKKQVSKRPIAAGKINPK